MVREQDALLSLSFFSLTLMQRPPRKAPNTSIVKVKLLLSTMLPNQKLLTKQTEKLFAIASHTTQSKEGNLLQTRAQPLM